MELRVALSNLQLLSTVNLMAETLSQRMDDAPNTGHLTYDLSTTAEDSLSAWALVEPTIDGIISNGEWNDAAKTDFTLVSQIGESHSASLWVKNDGAYLYLAFHQ